MPPKKTEAKKGPVYKQATPLKDIVPPTAKEPRQSKPIKIPDTFPDPPLKNKQAEDVLPNFFDEWPTDQAVKAYDFGIASDNCFDDSQHDQIFEYLKKELPNNGQTVAWKRLHELAQLKEGQGQGEESQMESYGEDTGREEKNQQKKEQGHEEQNQEPKQEEGKKEMVVIETFMRQQTEEEMERRKREEAQKAEKAGKDKKKGKKQEPKEEGPVQVSDVKMANISIKRYMCESGIWIGSQLQVVKARDLKDIYTEEAVWKKIYPQENGVPQITKSGKYWVKLFHMGKTVKVEVDDRIPINEECREIFPTSEKDNEKWSLILTKALVKYFSLVCPKEAIIGSGLIIYALTGLLTENIALHSFKDWQKIKEFMNNEHYRDKDIVVNCFTSSGNRKNPSNYIRSAQDIKDIVNLDNSTFRRRSKKRISQLDHELASKVQEMLEAEGEGHKIEEKYIDNLVIRGCAYSIGDFFQTQGFNMVFSKEKSTKEQKLRMEYNEMSKVSLTNKSRDEKLEHRRKKKQIKEKLLAEEKKRIEEINKPLVNYHFLKLLGNINIHCEYSHQEILLAKKCVLNNLSQPPNYEIPKIEAKDELKSSVSQIKFKEDSQVNIPLDDFGGMENAKQLFERTDEGIWIKDEDFLGTFDEIQIYYNPNVFENKSIEEVPHQCVGEFSYDDNKEILVVEKKGNPHMEAEMKEGEENAEEKQEKDEENISLLFGFSFQDSKWDTLSSPYCMLQKFDFDSYRTTSNVTTLSKILSSTYLSLKNQNSVFKLYTMSKGKYAYWISSNSPYKMLSIADYLTEYEGYSSKTFKIEYPPLEACNYQCLSRIKIKHEGEGNNAIIIKMKNCEKEVEKYLNYQIVEIPESGVYTQEETEGIIERKREELLMSYEYSRAELKPNVSYHLLLEAYTSSNIPEGAVDLVILSKESGASIEQIEQIEPYKFVEKYCPNKYANIFRERLFCNNVTNASLVFKVVEGEEGQPIAGGNKKDSKKGGKEEPAFEIVEKPLSEKRLVHVKILKNGALIYYSKGYNEVIISNIELESTKDDKNQYFVEACFDLREWPEASAHSEDNNKIYWSVQISADDSVAFAKDTLKEDQEKQTRKSWEEKQPGRADKAKRARQRFLLEQKKDRGEQLTEEELQIVNATRMTKKQLAEEEKKNEDKKGGKGAKKDDKKGAKDKKEEVVEEKKEERAFPKAMDNFMTEIKEFLKNLEDFKVQQIELKQGQNPRIRSDEEQNSIKEGAMMAKENKTAQIVRSVETRQMMKIREKDKRDKLTILLEDARSGFVSEWKKYIQWRMQDQEKDQSKQEKEKSVINIIKQQNPSITEADLIKMIAEYRGIEGHNSKLADVAEMIRKNIKIAGVSEKINNLLAGWEVEDLKATMEEVKNDKMEGIDSQIMGKVQEMLEEAEKNPAIVAEKQAEIKKGGKKGGKK